MILHDVVLWFIGVVKPDKCRSYSVNKTNRGYSADKTNRGYSADKTNRAYSILTINRGYFVEKDELRCYNIGVSARAFKVWRSCYGSN